MSPLVNLSQLFTCSVFGKFEASGPTGTQKDRIAEAHVKKAKSDGFSRIVAASCGNFGLALAYFASVSKLSAEIWIPESFDSPRVGDILQLGASVKRLPVTYEECVEQSSSYAKENGFYDANPTQKNRQLEYEAYGVILDEILECLPDVRTVACPVSNGVTLSALGFRACSLKKNICFIAGSSTCNPIVRSFQSNTKRYQDLNALDIEETWINEPLINWRSFDGEAALDVIISSEGAALGFSDDELLQASKELAQVGVAAHPAACAGFLALKHQSFVPPAVCIITAKAY